ncbi:DMT family transporter [Alteromonas sp. 5E99-2]|uniref:DMT family transporter n=1 Tax=Alteromonas sp. 5E99-2 TaxID=2817683 RepID=UPI001A9A164A|nr:DMT family transporter [Alteromonas sp. 5E99-2]MBO1256886.1 DMT family transporter [Alteromonas sp. 5E99-2]
MQLSSLVALFILAAIWGASFLFMRISAPEFGVITLVFIRALLAGIVLIPFVIAAKATKDLKQHWKAMAIVGLFNTAIPFALFNYSSLHLQAGVNAILNGTAPMFAALIAFIWLKDKLNIIAICGLVLGFAGVIAISYDKTHGSTISAIPILAALAATFCYGVAANYIKKSVIGCNPIALATGSQIFAALVLFPPMLFDIPPEVPSNLAWFSALGLSIFGTGIAYLLYFYLIGKEGASKAITVAYLVPLFGIIWGVLFLKESLSISVLLGGVLILLGVMLTTGVVSIKRKKLATQ